MEENAKWITLGRFGRPHGIKGFIILHSFTEPRDNILAYSELYAFINKQWQLITLSQVESHDKHILAKVKGYEEREQVAVLTNSEIGVRSEQLPALEPGEFYWHQLIDMQVVNQDGEIFGKVVEIMPTGSNDVLVVQGEKRYLIPYLLHRYIINIDLNQRQIIVDWDKAF